MKSPAQPVRFQKVQAAKKGAQLSSSYRFRDTTMLRWRANDNGELWLPLRHCGAALMANRSILSQDGMVAKEHPLASISDEARQHSMPSNLREPHGGRIY